METATEGQSCNNPALFENRGVSGPSLVDALAHPGDVFGNPMDVVDLSCFSEQEKRAILLSWVRDELVIEHVASRTMPELKPHSRIDAVLEALSRFDSVAAAEYRSAAALVRWSRMRQGSREAARAEEAAP